MSKDLTPYLVHMADALERITAYTSDGELAFEKETIIQDAVIRNLEVIGEAAKRIPEDFREKYPSIPWKRLAVSETF